MSNNNKTKSNLCNHNNNNNRPCHKNKNLFNKTVKLKT